MKEIAYEGPPLENNTDADMIPLRDRNTAHLPPLRTFQTDVTEKATYTTKMDVLMAERARKESVVNNTHFSAIEPEHHLGRIIFVLVLVLAFGIGVGLYALIGTAHKQPSQAAAQTPPEQAPPAPTPASIVINPSSREELLANIVDIFSATTLTQGESRDVELMVNDKATGTTAATTNIVFNTLGTLPPPQALLYSLDTNVHYGIYSTSERAGFFILHSRSYTETFAGMLAWEPAMAETLIPALHPRMKKGDLVLLRSRVFKDERIADTDARVLSDPDGVAAIAYAFSDQHTLIIAGNRETLQALIEQAHSQAK